MDPAEMLRPEAFPYPSRRMPIVAAKGVVATSQPLAAQAGLTMLQRGGNAVDAILATAITLTVVEPTSNGIGADAFALVWDGNDAAWPQWLRACPRDAYAGTLRGSRTHAGTEQGLAPRYGARCARYVAGPACPFRQAAVCYAVRACHRVRAGWLSALARTCRRLGCVGARLQADA